MTALLTKYLIEFNKLNTHRKIWMYSSIITMILTFIVLLNWGFIEAHNLYWPLIVSGVVLIICWWFWTMILVKRIIEHKILETIILKEIINDFYHIRKNITEIDQE